MAKLMFLSRFRLVSLMTKNFSNKPHKVRSCPHHDQHKILAGKSNIPTMCVYTNIKMHTLWGHMFWMAKLMFLSRFRLVPLMTKNCSHKPYKVRNSPQNDQHKIFGVCNECPHNVCIYTQTWKYTPFGDVWLT